MRYRNTIIIIIIIIIINIIITIIIIIIIIITIIIIYVLFFCCLFYFSVRWLRWQNGLGIEAWPLCSVWGRQLYLHPCERGVHFELA